MSGIEQKQQIKTVVAGCFAAVLLFCVWNAGNAFAQEDPPCAEDIQSFCKDVYPGGGGILACLKRHESGLSPVCREKLLEVQRRIDEFKLACATDVDRFCAAIEPGGGRIARCLAEHAVELRPACAEKIDRVRAKLKVK